MGTSREFYTPQEHILRRKESLAINEAGPLIAATRASVVHYMGTPLDSAITLRDQTLGYFQNGSTRQQKISCIKETELLCRRLSSTINPGCHESSIAFNTRRLNVIQQIVKSEIAEGKLAVDTADLLIGNFNFNIDNMNLVIDWQREKEIISRNGKNN